MVAHIIHRFQSSCETARFIAVLTKVCY